MGTCRGRPILVALIQHLLDNGMKDATDVILTGCSGDKVMHALSFHLCITIIFSAGGVATIIDADFVATLLPQGIKYKAMTDGGLAKLLYKSYIGRGHYQLPSCLVGLFPMCRVWMVLEDFNFTYKKVNQLPAWNGVSMFRVCTQVK